MQTDKQVLYLGRWVSREHFRVFVYNSTGQKLVKSYDEFSDAISSGIWFAEQKDIPVALAANDTKDNVTQLRAKRGKKCQSQQQR